MKAKTRTVIAAISLGLAAFGGIPVVNAATKFNVSMWLPPAHPLTKYGYIEWVEQVKKQSNGELQPQLFAGTALLAPEDHLSGVRDGMAQVAWHAGGYTPSDLPEDNVLFQLSFIYTDYWVGAFTVTEMNMTDPQLLEQWRRNNIVYGGGFSTPPYRLICTSKITTLDDIKGKKLRSGGGALPDWAESVGAVPVSVASSETFTGLEKGQLDCATNALDDLRSRSYWDVAKHVTLVELGVYWSGYEYGINRDFWNDLEVRERKVLLDTMATAIVNTGIGYLADVEEIKKQAKEHGVNFYDPSPALKASVEEFGQTVPKHAAKIGVERFGIENAADLVGRFEKVAKKWRKLLDGVDHMDRETLLALLKQEVYDRIDPATYGTQ